MMKGNVKPLGRTWLDGDNILWCGLSGSGIEFEISASRLELTLAGDSGANPNNKDGNARFAVYVNGERVIDEQIDGKEKSCVVFDTQTAANVKLIKLSESANSVFGIKGIASENCVSLKPADNKPLLIEFIGDSITCGYGVDDEVKENHFSTSTEDITKAYAYKTAENLNADYSMVSYSGYGIISGYSDDGRKSVNQLVPEYYDKTGFSYGSANGRKLETVPWDFSVRQPGIVVINLGTNDSSYTKNDPEKCAEYQTEYTAFLKAVHEKNPDAKIICSLGIMGQDLYTYMENAVSDYSRETGDDNVSCFKFDVQDMAADGIAADWHPSEKTHEKAARKLAKEIAKLYGSCYSIISRTE
ncbi:MAG: GDSL-type esterase/lipase family protein [Oscillospiraceae bacterium]|jgi:lysophospholipase L1-like esterase|nr:GDSL-type esterase/lipase family protein [Oscillospiraceae bacterium]